MADSHPTANSSPVETDVVGRHRPIGTLALVLILSALSSGVGTGSAVGPLLALIATLGLLREPFRPPSCELPRIVIPTVVVAGALSPYLLGTAFGTTYWCVALALAGAGAVGAYLTLRTPQLSRVVLVLHSIVSVATLLAVMPNETTDVWFLHDQAGTITREGGNPWTDLRIFNGAPGAEGKVIEGYAYPPLILFTYAVAGTAFGEPRIITGLAWVVSAAVFAVTARRRRDVLIHGWTLSVQPAWALMLWAGWTEPISIALAALAWAAWFQFPILRSLLLGLVLASKQYFAVLGVIVLQARSLLPIHRAVALGVASVTVGVAVMWGWQQALDALVKFHADQPPRADGLTLFGLVAAFGTRLPLTPWLAVTAAVVAAALLGRCAVNRSTTFVTSAAVLAVFFLLGTQAFANYWFVVLSLLVLAQASVIADPESPA